MSEPQSPPKQKAGRSPAPATDHHSPTPAKLARLHDALQSAEHDLAAALQRAGLFDPDPDDPGLGTPVGRLFSRFQCARYRVESFHENRCRRLETALRKAAAPPNGAATALAAVYGPTGRRRNVHILHDAERRMVDDYRRMDNAGRQMIRVLFQRLARTSQHQTKRGGA